jgi:hypothetical protein
MPVTIVGTFMDRSLNNFQQACEFYIDNEQEKLLPDNDLIALLSDAIRLTRELTWMTEHRYDLDAARTRRIPLH